MRSRSEDGVAVQLVQHRRALRHASAILYLTVASCVVHHHVDFGTGVLPSSWRSVQHTSSRTVFHDAAGGSISMSSSCNVSDADAPLDVLTNHLLFELESVHEHARVTFVLAGRAALRTTLDAKLDGVDIGLDLVVLKVDGCSVDLQLVAAPGTLPARRADFDGFVAAFSFRRGG